MVLDQLTLLYVPLRIITDMEVKQGDERVLAMKGSITLSQNPVVDFDYRVNGAETMHVLVRRQRRRVVAAQLPHWPGQLGQTNVSRLASVAALRIGAAHARR